MALAETPLALLAGETRTLAVTVTRRSTDAFVNLLTEVSAIELQVKAQDGDADPPLISKSVGSGIVIRDPQTGDDLGVCDITLDPADTASLSGVYRYDLVVTLTGGERLYGIRPSDFVVDPVVNPV
jgi:hypothetical protein